MLVRQGLTESASIAILGGTTGPGGYLGHAGGGLTVTDLVERARAGDRQAWDALVDRYAPLIWSICRRFRLSDADADDVGQNVWLQLVHHLDTLHYPAALPGWLATTTRRECLRVLRTARGPQRSHVLDAEIISDPGDEAAEQGLLDAERHAALREAFGHLSPSGQRLMSMLVQDPPLPYAEISARLGIPVGSIGPSRRRCLDQIRRHPAIAALISADRDPDDGRNRGAGRCVQRSFVGMGAGR